MEGVDGYTDAIKARGFVGGCFLGRRKSAKSVFQKSELAYAQTANF